MKRKINKKEGIREEKDGKKTRRRERARESNVRNGVEKQQGNSEK